jgi:hypothetical protein
MTDLSIAIQHTPSRPDRRRWVHAMIKQLRNENASIPIALIEDSQLEGCWPTYRRALEAAGDDAVEVSGSAPVVVRLPVSFPVSPAAPR